MWISWEHIRIRNNHPSPNYIEIQYPQLLQVYFSLISQDQEKNNNKNKDLEFISSIYSYLI